MKSTSLKSIPEGQEISASADQATSVRRGTWVQRYVLPGLAFKAVVIGGGYATGRELAEFFLPSGPRGGLAGMALATLVWSIVCSLTFALATAFRLLDYRSFFGKLLGRGWIVFEITYLLFVLLVISVFAATIGAVGQALFSWPPIVGSIALLAGIAVTVGIGERAVEPLFKYVSILLYVTYAVFLALSIAKFGGRIPVILQNTAVEPGWITGGLTYAGYNSVAAVVILPVLRHIHRPREALIAGALAGPLAMVPGFFFFLAMIAWYPEIIKSVLPSDFLLTKIGIPVVRFIFQAMIFFALLESGSGLVHAVRERLRHALGRKIQSRLSLLTSTAMTLIVLMLCTFVAQAVGLVDLIARGYRFIAWIFIAIFIVPLIGVSVLKPRAFLTSDRKINSRPTDRFPPD